MVGDGKEEAGIVKVRSYIVGEIVNNGETMVDYILEEIVN